MTRLERVLLVLAFGGLVLVVGVQLGIRHGRDLAAQERPITDANLVCGSISLGELIYLDRPAAILDAIRVAEGVPSYGVMPLARLAGAHGLVPEKRGREAAALLVHQFYRQWAAAGRPGEFLAYLRDHYCGPGCVNWLANVVSALPDDVFADAARNAVGDR